MNQKQGAACRNRATLPIGQDAPLPVVAIDTELTILMVIPARGRRKDFSV
jgi:hypothetical protein